jgi:hypothetical protein
MDGIFKVGYREGIFRINRIPNLERRGHTYLEPPGCIKEIEATNDKRKRGGYVL